MTIGERIRYKREELKMTQAELAQKAGYTSRSTINKIELNANGVTQSKLVNIAKALGVSPAYLMGWEEEAEAPSKKKDLIKAVENMSEREIDLMISIAQSIIDQRNNK